MEELKLRQNNLKRDLADAQKNTQSFVEKNKILVNQKKIVSKLKSKVLKSKTKVGTNGSKIGASPENTGINLPSKLTYTKPNDKTKAIWGNMMAKEKSRSPMFFSKIIHKKK